MNEQGRVRNITDLAKLAGVSPGTVSRALADSPLIARITRARIQKIAKEHDFRPNVMARNLRIRRAGAIGALMPSVHEAEHGPSDPIKMRLFGHLADALTDRGYDLILSRVVSDSHNWLNRAAESGRFDGLILIGHSQQFEALDALASRYLPLVVWDADSPGQAHCSVGSDHRKGGELAAQHLIDRGCRHFAFIGDDNVTELSERIAGCRTALVTAGLDDALSILPMHSVAQTIHPALVDWLDQTKSASRGIIASTDMVALGVLQSLNAQGVSVPDDVRIVGYGDLPFAAHTIPALTTVRPDLSAVAAKIVEQLFRRIDGEDAPSVMIEPNLLIRQSS